MNLPNPDIDTIPALAFSYTSFSTMGFHGWHSHERHHLVYTRHGSLRVEVPGALWLLPPQRAAWVGAGVPHYTRYLTATEMQAICIAPQFISVEMPTRVFSITPLAREMLLFASRWGTDRDPDDARANLYFQTFVMLCQQWMQEERAFRLPRPQSESLSEVVAYVLTNLETADLQTAADLIAVSPRTLRRQMQREMQTTWRDFLHDARMMQAMELLAGGDVSVTETAVAVGFNSLSAFTKAFTQFTGEQPSRYLSRCVRN